MAKAYGALYGIRLNVEDIPRSNPNRTKTWDRQNEDIKKGINIYKQNIILREPTKEEKKEFDELIEFKPEIGVQLIIEANYDKLKDCFDGIYNTVYTLRLIKNHVFFLRYIFYKSKIITSNKMGESYHPQMKIEYKLYYNEIDSVKKIFNKVNKINYDKNKNYSITAYRFYKSYIEFNIEEKTIDYCIAFESLFTKGEDLGPKGKIIGLSCSMLLGKNNAERRSINQHIIRLFKSRNSIIHGKEYDKKILRTMMPKTYEYLKKSLVKLMPP